jgi:2-polyprenyl-3-methyl-5-hydroxy-6-metoxy-1,4-benzoquinol methylase
MTGASTTTSEYVLGRTPQEHERLRRQAQVWQDATTTLLDRVSPAPGARCLDVGCGPGEVMRLMAERVGPAGRVVGMDTDADLGRAAVDALRTAGHRQCSFVEADATQTEAVADQGFDLVFGRLILLHVPDPVAVLRRMWQWTAPGGHLVIQDYDMRGVDAYPQLALVDEWKRVFLGTFTAAGRDIRLGHRLPSLFAEAGIGPPDGTEVAGRLERLELAGGMLAATYRSVSPTAIRLGIITEEQRDTWLTDLTDAISSRAAHSLLWPLLIGVHKRRIPE